MSGLLLTAQSLEQVHSQPLLRRPVTNLAGCTPGMSTSQATPRGDTCGLLPPSPAGARAPARRAGNCPHPAGQSDRDSAGQAPVRGLLGRFLVRETSLVSAVEGDDDLVGASGGDRPISRTS